MAENLTHLSFYGCPCYLQDCGRSVQNEGARVVIEDLPLKVYAVKSTV